MCFYTLVAGVGLASTGSVLACCAFFISVLPFVVVCLCSVVGTAFSRSHEDHAGVRFCVDRNMPVGAQSGGSALERQEAGTKESNVSWKWQGCSLTKGVTEDYILPQQENRPLQAQ